MKEKTAIQTLIEKIDKDILENPYYKNSQRLKIGAQMVSIMAKELLELEKRQKMNDYNQGYRDGECEIFMKNKDVANFSNADQYFTDTYEQGK